MSAAATIAELFRSDREAIEHRPLFAELPDSAVDAGLPVWWDQAALFRVADTLAPETIPVASVEWVLDVRWARDAPSLRETLAAGVAASPDYRRVLDTDLSFPIVLAAKGERWVVADGYHRVAHAVQSRHPTIAAVRLPAARVREILRSDSPFFEALNALGREDPDALATVRQLARRSR